MWNNIKRGFGLGLGGGFGFALGQALARMLMRFAKIIVVAVGISGIGFCSLHDISTIQHKSSSQTVKRIS